MDDDEITDKDVTRIGKLASRSFLNIEFFAYLGLGLLFALTALLGVAAPRSRSGAMCRRTSTQLHLFLPSTDCCSCSWSSKS